MREFSPTIRQVPLPAVFSSLELGRFFAALGVCLFHASGTIARFQGNHPFDDIARGGHAGVEYFFVLSGFLMTVLYKGRPTEPVSFAAKRLIRIMPLYWLAVTVIAMLTLAMPGLGKDRSIDLVTLIKNYLLLVEDKQLYIGVAWTLQREFVFYILLAIGFLVPRLGFNIFWLWQGAILIATLIHPALSYSIRHDPILGVHNLGFGIGALIGLSIIRYEFPRATARAFIGVGGAFLVVLLLAEWWIGAGTDHDEAPFGELLSPLLYYAAVGPLFFGLVHYEMEQKQASSLSRMLGGSSYALYLFHGFIISILARAIKPAWGLPTEIILIVITAACILISIAIHLVLEKPVLTMLRRGLLSRRRGARVDATASERGS